MHVKTLGIAVMCLWGVGTGVSSAEPQCTANELVGLIASDNAPGDILGGAIAVQGNVAVVGAAAHSDNGDNSGAAYIFYYNGSGWVQLAKLLPSDGAVDDYFGFYVAIDGDTVVIGSYGADIGGNIDVGAAYVFVEPIDGWSDMAETAKLTAFDGAAGDALSVVGICGDTIIVGAPRSSVHGDLSGSAYVFEKPEAGWENATETAKLLPSDGLVLGVFGADVAIAGDTILLGSGNDDDLGYRSGSVYVFKEPETGWANATENEKLAPSDGHANQAFGGALAFSGDTAVIGSAYDDDNGWHSGSAYVLSYDDTDWVWLAKLLPSNGTTGDVFGETVGLSGDIVVVGGSRHQAAAPVPGAGYAFKRPASGWQDMTETVELFPTDSAPGDHFGGETGLGVSDGIAVIGALYSDGNGEDSGSAYAFHGLSDCNGNGILDICDVDDGTSLDVNGNGLPDECDPGACRLADFTCVTHLSQSDCESQGGTYDGGATTCDWACPEHVPAVSTWGMVVLVLLVLTAGTVVVGRRRIPAEA